MLDFNTQPSYNFTFTAGERRVFRAKEDLKVSQWAERYRVVAAGGRQSRWSNARVPYAAEVMDLWNVPYTRRIILCWGPQTGKTNIALNCLGYAIDQDPGPAMYCMPDEKLARRINKKRIKPMAEATPRLSALLSDRADDITSYSISFTHGMDVYMAWAGSPSATSSESTRYLIRDEVDKWPEFSADEGDPMSLTEIRTITFPYTKKILDISTPTDDDGNIIKAMADEADEIRRYKAVCPICDNAQIMEFDQFHWPGMKTADPRLVKRKKLARYTCARCGMDWDDFTRTKAVSRGFWQSDEPVTRPEVVAFHLPGWYSPDVSLSDSAAAYLRGLDDPAKEMIFVTQHKAVAYSLAIDSKEEGQILKRRTDLPAMVVPAAAVALTCGIDMQQKGFWFIVRAWEKDLTSHLIQYGYVSSWADVETLIFNTRYQQQDSDETLSIWRAALDTGGGPGAEDEWTRTEEAYAFLRKNIGRGHVLHGIKGSSRNQLNRIRVTVIDKMPRSHKKIVGGLELRLLDTAQFKDLLHWRLTRTDDEPQRFYLHKDTGMDYAKQFLAEEKKRHKRRKKTEWVKIRRDNHLLDCEVYAAACADGEWVPSLQMIAKRIETDRVETTAPQPRPATSEKPGWLSDGRKGRKGSWLNQ